MVELTWGGVIPILMQLRLNYLVQKCLVTEGINFWDLFVQLGFGFM